MSYLGVFAAEIPILHEVRTATGQTSNHGNVIYSYGQPIQRFAISFQPLHKIPHHDPVSADYVARTMADFLMEVPDGTLYSKDDRVTWNGLVYLVEGVPLSWGLMNPFGLDQTMFGASIHLERVS